MPHFVVSQSRVRSVELAAKYAQVRLLSGVQAQMSFQQVASTEALLARCTRIRLLLSVCALVTFQMVAANEAFPADPTLERFFSGVRAFMGL